MLNVESFVPAVYVKESRDFQMFCKALEIIINDVKYNADTITDVYNPFKCRNRMLELLCTLYNYQPRRDISDTELRIILANYMYLVKHKGTRKGIEAAISLAVKLTGKSLSWSCDIQTKDNQGNSLHKVIVSISGTYDRRYLQEFMNVVLPVGYVLEDSVASYKAKDSEATVQMTTDKDIDEVEDVSSVISLSDAETSKSSIERVEVLRGEENE